jgi:hypothetical protein
MIGQRASHNPGGRRLKSCPRPRKAREPRPFPFAGCFRIRFFCQPLAPVRAERTPSWTKSGPEPWCASMTTIGSASRFAADRTARRKSSVGPCTNGSRPFLAARVTRRGRRVPQDRGSAGVDHPVRGMRYRERRAGCGLARTPGARPRPGRERAGSSSVLPRLRAA